MYVPMSNLEHQVPLIYMVFTLFCCSHEYQQNRSSESVTKFGKVIVYLKSSLKTTKVVCAENTQKSSSHRNLVHVTFSELQITFSKNVNLLFLLYLIVLWCLSNLFVKSFVETNETYFDKYIHIFVSLDYFSIYH